MTSVSDEKIIIICFGNKNVTAVNITPTVKENLSAIPKTFSIVFVSPFPQYWAVRTAAPEVSPKKIKLIINWTWFPREEADKTVSLTFPSIITSAEVTPTLIKFCKAIGTTNANTIL